MEIEQIHKEMITFTGNDLALAIEHYLRDKGIWREGGEITIWAMMGELSDDPVGRVEFEL